MYADVLKAKHVIYAIKCLPTGRAYIGCSYSFDSRIAMHFQMLRKRKHCSKLMQADYDAHGRGVFVVKKCFVLPSRKDGLSWERQFVKRLHSRMELYNSLRPLRLSDTQGKKPRSYSLPVEAVNWLAREADRHGRSVSDHLCQILQPMIRKNPPKCQQSTTTSS